METYQNYPTSYPDSGNSSPRSREIDFENTAQPWDVDNYKVKFLCSYGGKIHPRPHDNQLSYIGGETKILAVDRNVKFSTMIAKLSALCDTDNVTFKYQLPGEDLDHLISVTNDDDVEHMMHEYERLFRGSGKPARMRLFLFPLSQREEQPAPAVDSRKAAGVQSNVDFLFGLERGVAPAPPQPQPPPVVPEPVVPDDRSVGSDHDMSTMELQRELQRLQIGAREQQGLYRRRSEDYNQPGELREYYMQRVPEKGPPANIPVSVPQAGYWPDKQVPASGFPPTVSSTPPQGIPEHQVYMIPGPVPGTVYHAPPPSGMVRPVAGHQAGQGYYTMQRMGSGSNSGPGPDIYRDQPVYNVVTSPHAPPPSAAPPVTLPPQQQPKPVAYTEGMGMPRTSGGGMMPEIGGYAQVGYDSAGRQVYYTAGGGMVAAPPGPPYHGVAGGGADVRTSAVLTQEAKVVAKVSQGSV